MAEDIVHCGNTGNLVIGEAADDCVAQYDSTYIPYWEIDHLLNTGVSPAEFREHFDIVVIATANLIRVDYSAIDTYRILSTLQLPTVMLGAGLQDVERLHEVPEGTVRLFRYMADNGDTVFARGRLTADYLDGLGVGNLFAAGCPSIYFRPDGMRQAIRAVPSMRFDDSTRLMVAGYLGQDYTSDDINALRARTPHLHYMLQDEFNFYGMTFAAEANQGRTYDPATGEIRSAYQHEQFRSDDYLPSVHIFFNNEDWRAFSATLDGYVGRRFHGGIIPMQAGVPTIFVANDDRMDELTELMGFARIMGQSYTDSPDKVRMLEDLVAGFEAEAAVRLYDEREAAFRSQLRAAIG